MSSRNEYVFHSSKLPNGNYLFFEEMRLKGKLCDITFQVGDHSISAHRVILAAAIPYFRDVTYAHSATGPTEGEIELPETDHCGFVSLIQFAYTCRITITMENVKGLLSSSCALHVDEVRDACCEFLQERLDAEIALDIRPCAHSLGCISLVEAVDFHIRKNFDVVSQSERFLDLPCSYLKDLIGRDDLNVTSEEKVFETVIRWVQKSPSERIDEMPQLLKNVRMALLKPHYLNNCVANQDLIGTSKELRDLVDAVKDYGHFPEKQEGSRKFCVEPRQFVDECKRPSVSPLIFTEKDPVESSDNAAGTNESFGICKLIAKTTCSIQCFDSESSEWRTNHSKTVFHDDGSFAAVGGKACLFCENFTLAYDPVLGDIKFLRGSDRRFTGVTVHKGSAYVCGGIEDTGETEVTNKVEMFCPETEEWFVDIPNMKFGRQYPAVAALKGCIYVFGGIISNVISNIVERYEVQNKKWTQISPMLIGRYAPAATSLNGKLYVCGGRSESSCLRTAEVFNLKRKEWTLISPMNTGRCKFSLLSYCGRLYAFRGEDAERNVVNATEIYDPRRNKWVFGKPLDSDVKISGAFAIS